MVLKLKEADLVELLDSAGVVIDKQQAIIDSLK
jgi:hypothetical protein